MFPILYTIGPFNVYSFGFFLALSFIVSTFTVWKFARNELKEEEYLDAYLATCVAALFASRVFYIAFHPDEFGSNILAYFLVRHTPGLSLPGALFGGVLFLWWYAKKKKLRFLHVADIFSVASSFALMLAKIGEQLGGVGFGQKTDSFLGVGLVGKEGMYHPVELYEAAAFLALGVVTTVLYHKTQKKYYRDGFVAQIFALITLGIIFGLEFLKVRSVYLYGLSIRQIAVSIAFMFIFAMVSRSLAARFRFVKKE